MFASYKYLLHTVVRNYALFSLFHADYVKHDSDPLFTFNNRN